ncbi:hydrogenase maturation nickel metallochaperone HypA, partial [Candidatus Methylobacter oryzae]
AGCMAGIAIMTNPSGADLHLPAGCMAGIAMHEMSLCESILQVLEQQAEVQQYNKVKTVWLEIGALSNVEIDALRFSFDVVVQGSIADHAQLEIIEVPGQAWCMQCSRNVVVQQLYDLCPHCGSHQLQVNSGDQMRIKELEVE